MDLQAFQRMMNLFGQPMAQTGIDSSGNSIDEFENAQFENDMRGGPFFPPSDKSNVSNSTLDQFQPRTQISDQLTSHLANMPVRPDVSNLRKIGAGIASFGAGGSAQAVVGGQPIGYKYDPVAADRAGDKVKYGDFDNQLNDWQNQIKALGIGANEEDRANAGEVKRLAGNAKNDIDQQKADIASRRADSYQQNADTAIQKEADIHETAMQKLRDAIELNDKKLAIAQQNANTKHDSVQAQKEFHDAEIAGMRLRDQYRAEDAEGKLKLNELRTKSTIEHQRILNEAIQNGKVTDTNVTYDTAGNRTGTHVTSGSAQKMVKVIDKNGKPGSVPENKVEEFIRDHGGKRVQ